MLVNATETIEGLRKVAARRGARRGLLEDRQRALVELLRFGVFAQHVKRSSLQIERPGIALVLGSEARPGSGFEFPRFGKSRVIIAGLEKIVVTLHIGFEVGLGEGQTARHDQKQHQQQACR